MTQCHRICASPKMLARQKVSPGRHREAASVLGGDRLGAVGCQGMSLSPILSGNRNAVVRDDLPYLILKSRELILTSR